MRILIIGAAVSGTAAAKLSRRLGYELSVYDHSAKAVASLRDDGYTVHSGTWTDHLLREVDLVVTSPGVPERSAPIRAVEASDVRLVSELEFGASHLDAPYAAVTGTNGKTTVTTLTAQMLSASGLGAVDAGNVGTAVSSIADEKWDVVVLEASSFQLRFIETFHPRWAAVTNVAPDHLDWHGSLDAYTAAKSRIFENMTGDDTLFYDTDDAGAVRLVESANCAVVPASGTHRPQGGVGAVDGAIVVGDHHLPTAVEDPSFLLDLSIAAALALQAGADSSFVAGVIAGFRFGPHRRSLVGEWDGIKWVDDSKATNPHAAAAAAAAYPSVVLIAGGRNKGLDLSAVASAPTAVHVIAYGEAADEIQASAPAKVTVVPDVDSAIRVADERAVPGDTVLLAPGCASFDQFTSYAERGDAFARAVKSLKESA